LVFGYELLLKVKFDFIFTVTLGYYCCRTQTYYKLIAERC